MKYLRLLNNIKINKLDGELEKNNFYQIEDNVYFTTEQYLGNFLLAVKLTPTKESNLFNFEGIVSLKDNLIIQEFDKEMNLNIYYESIKHFFEYNNIILEEISQNEEWKEFLIDSFNFSHYETKSHNNVYITLSCGLKLDLGIHENCMSVYLRSPEGNVFFNVLQGLPFSVHREPSYDVFSAFNNSNRDYSDLVYDNHIIQVINQL